MKKIIILFIVGLFAFQTTSLWAQTDSDVVTFTVELQTVFDIEITANNSILVVFATAAEYTNGIVSADETTFTVEATQDWEVMIDGDGNLTPGATGSGFIPLNYVGCWARSTGNFVDGTEIDIQFPDQANAHGLTTTSTLFVDNNSSNAGDASDNTYVITWAVGTQSGSMAAESVYDGLNNSTFTAPGVYSTNINLTLQLDS